MGLFVIIGILAAMFFMEESSERISDEDAGGGGSVRDSGPRTSNSKPNRASVARRGVQHTKGQQGKVPPKTSKGSTEDSPRQEEAAPVEGAPAGG